MKKTILLALALLLGAGASWGASTEDNRDNSLLYVGISPIGIHVPTLATHPVALGVYLGKSFLVGVEYGSAKVKVKNGKGEFGPIKGDVPVSNDVVVDGDYTNTGAFLKWFPGTNSFNITLAANQRKWDVDLAAFATDPSTGISVPFDAKIKADATVATLGLGNQWIMDFGMVVGVDWLLASGISSKSSSAKITTPLLPGYQVSADKETKKNIDDLNTISGLPGALVLSVGWAF